MERIGFTCGRSTRPRGTQLNPPTCEKVEERGCYGYATNSRMSVVLWDIWIFMGRPVDSIRLATSTVSLEDVSRTKEENTHPKTL